MELFKKNWTPHQADRWTMHDILAGLLAVSNYVLIAIGTAGALLARTWGYVCLATGVVCVVLMVKVIDPKLKAMSGAYEEKEKGFLDHVEKTTRWEV